jgi:glycogen operon protein
VIKDIAWMRSDGQEMTDMDWNSSWHKCIGILYAGEDRNEVDEKGTPLNDDIVLMILNSYHDKVQFVCPRRPQGPKEVLIDTILLT